MWCGFLRGSTSVAQTSSKKTFLRSGSSFNTFGSLRIPHMERKAKRPKIEKTNNESEPKTTLRRKIQKTKDEPELKTDIPTFHADSGAAFRHWLTANHMSYTHVLVTRYKKNASVYSSPSPPPPPPKHLELMHEAICFGWIDTTAKRIDDDLTAINFRKRKRSGRWSNNTLSYAKKLIEEGRMTNEGLIAYEWGKDKPTIDHNIPRDAPTPSDLKAALSASSTLESFESLATSSRRVCIVWVEKAKRSETRARRIESLVTKMKNGVRELKDLTKV
eukprot:TRINITY_DN7994_c0_g1_i1.p1 TRINITY_DN7994_c0_g1~~TRINITY_DN7994_c0_g1_i1.p1  ORF type:complete len:275 (+),score=54.59 TRINITY_DN7994_c0_g1_i1:9-833(+)